MLTGTKSRLPDEQRRALLEWCAEQESRREIDHDAVWNVAMQLWFGFDGVGDSKWLRVNKHPLRRLVGDLERISDAWPQRPARRMVDATPVAAVPRSTAWRPDPQFAQTLREMGLAVPASKGAAK